MGILKFFVSPDIAVLAKEIGFNEPCDGYYDDNHLVIKSVNRTGNWDLHNDYCLAPKYDQLINFFKTTHNLNICIKQDNDEYCVYIEDLTQTQSGCNNTTHQKVIDAIYCQKSATYALSSMITSAAKLNKSKF